MNVAILTKKQQFSEFLSRGGVFVHLDPRRSGVEVPPHLADRARLVLMVRQSVVLPIPDLETDEVGVRCTLTFGGAPFRCALPWSAVFSLVAEDGELTVWRQDLPAEVAASRGATMEPDRPISIPPPRIGRVGGSKRPTRAPSITPDALTEMLRIPRAPQLPTFPSSGRDEPTSIEAASRESRTLRANDSLAPVRGARPTRH